MININYRKLPELLSSRGFEKLCHDFASKHYIRSEGFRTQSYNLPKVPEVATVVRWMLLGPKCESSTSYGAKHEAEHWGQALSMEPYVSNGAAILAMAILQPYWIPPTRERGPNIKWKNIRDKERAFWWLEHQVVRCEPPSLDISDLLGETAA